MVGGWRLEFGESAKTKRKKEIALACEDSPECGVQDSSWLPAHK